MFWTKILRINVRKIVKNVGKVEDKFFMDLYLVYFRVFPANATIKTE